MKKFLLVSVVFLGKYAATAVHWLQYLDTASSGVPGLPEFVSVGLLDGQPFIYYDSNIREAKPRQEWIKKSEGAEYWENQTRIFIAEEHQFKDDFETVKERFEHAGGVHCLQRMYGCEWDDETGDEDGFDQYGYDGEDFISLDLKNDAWIAARQEAFVTQQKWDHLYYDDRKIYITKICPEELKKYVSSAGASLMRKEFPSVFLLQRTPSSAVTCFATGFYPDRADLSWRRDNEELHEDVDRGQILPNNDGTFQMSAHLDVSAVKAEDRTRYSCVFQLYGDQGYIITRLDKDAIRTNRKNRKKSEWIDFVIAAAAVGGMVVLILLISCAVIRLRRASAKERAWGKEREEIMLSQNYETSMEDQSPKDLRLYSSDLFSEHHPSPDGLTGVHHPSLNGLIGH